MCGCMKQLLSDVVWSFIGFYRFALCRWPTFFYSTLETVIERRCTTKHNWKLHNRDDKNLWCLTHVYVACRCSLYLVVTHTWFLYSFFVFICRTPFDDQCEFLYVFFPSRQENFHLFFTLKPFLSFLQLSKPFIEFVN